MCYLPGLYNTLNFANHVYAKSMHFLWVNSIKYSRNCVNHVYAEFYAAVCVVGPGVRDPTHAVVAVAQQLDTQAVVLVSQLVKP